MTEISSFRKRVLQSRINAVVRTANAAFEAQNRLNQYCETIYGCIPSDLDADGILDGVFGYNGATSGMTADDFDAEMRECIRRENK